MSTPGHRFPHAGRREARGFTVIELLVAVAITAAMSAIMLAMTTNIMSSWTRASGSLSAQTQARTALDYLQRDLERAIFRRDGNIWFAVDTLSDPNVWQAGVNGKPVNPSAGAPDSDWDPEQDRFGWAGVWLRFFTSDPDVNAVSYQIVRRTVTSSTQSRSRYMLYRARAGSGNTFGAGYNIVDGDYNPGTNVGSDGSGTTAGTAGEVQQPNRESLLASNVVDFGIRLFWRTPESPGVATSPMRYMEIFPDPGGMGDAQLAHRSPPLPGATPRPQDFTDNNPGAYNYSNPEETIAGRATPGNASSRIPNMAEVSLRVLTDEGAKILANYEEGQIEGDWWEIVEEHSKLFTRRVVLQNAPDTF